MSQKSKLSSADWLKAYYDELSELNMPYTDDELDVHIHHREWKSVLEMIHAHNWQLIMLALEWTEYLLGHRKRPVKKICKFVNPSQSPDINNACSFIKELVEMMCKYGEGKCPQARINTYCSRSTATLIDRLERIHHSEHLTRAECAAAKLFKFITYGGEPSVPHDEYCKLLHDLAETFVTECTLNAVELAQFTADAVAKIEGDELANIYRQNCKPISAQQAIEMLNDQTKELNETIKSEGVATRKDTAEIKATVDDLEKRVKKYHSRKTSKFTSEQQNDIYTI